MEQLGMSAYEDQAEDAPKGVNTFISDIFFNTDNGGGWENGDWDHSTLRAYAVELLGQLEGIIQSGLSVNDLPTADALVDDYLERV